MGQRDNKIKKILIISLILILVIFLVSSCFAASGSGNNIIDIIRIGDATGDWGFPSPYGMYSRGPGYIRMSLIFDTLVWKDREGNIIPMLVENWDYDESSNTFNFKLRKGVKWHDGEEFDASDVIFTFKYIDKNPWVWVDSSFIDSVKKINDYEVSITLSQKYAPFLSNIAGTLPILPEHIWAEIEEPLTYIGSDALTGTGPFMIEDYNASEGSYLFKANPDYYIGKVSVSNIAFIKVSEETTPAMLKNGKINAGAIPPDLVAELEEENLMIEEEPPVWAAKLLINHESNEIFKEKAFRQALAYAINTEQIVEISQRGFAVVGSAGLIPPANSFWYNEETPVYEYNPLKTAELIEGLGWKKGQDGYYHKDGNILEMELAVSPGVFERDAQIVKANLEDAGMKIGLISYESKTLDSMVEEWNFDLAISGHGGLGGDPESLNRVIIGEGFNSVRYFKNKRMIELLKSQITEMDQDVRKEIIYEIQEIYADELPSITLYYPKRYWAHDEEADISYTEGGLAMGIPIPINKIAFID